MYVINSKLDIKNIDIMYKNSHTLTVGLINLYVASIKKYA